MALLEGSDGMRMHMAVFQDAVMVASLSACLVSGRPLRRVWSFPSNVRDAPHVLRALFGGVGYLAYAAMPPVQQEEACAWFEVHGARVIALLEGEAWEDWSGAAPPKFNLAALKASRPHLYSRVAYDIAAKLAGSSLLALSAISDVAAHFDANPDALTAVLQCLYARALPTPSYFAAPASSASRLVEANR